MIRNFNYLYLGIILLFDIHQSLKFYSMYKKERIKKYLYFMYFFIVIAIVAIIALIANYLSI